MTSIQLEATPSAHQQSSEHTPSNPPASSSPLKNSSSYKDETRRSLRASSLDGTFSAAFENVVRGVLIGNFLLGLGAGAFEIGLLTSIPMLAHLLQPLGAHFSEKSQSRHQYCLWIYGSSRLLWLLPAIGIFLFSHELLTTHQLTLLTIAVLAASNVLDSIGSASWVSWMAVLVPAQLRGRYFSLRRSLSSLTALLTVPIGGWLVSTWMGGEIEGYGIALIIAVVMGVASLGFQFQIRDVNPQVEAAKLDKRISEHALENADINQVTIDKKQQTRLLEKCYEKKAEESDRGLLGDRNFLTLLFFLGLWTFAFNLSAPFFNFYLLETLSLDVQWVTLYGGLVHGAFFLMIMLWGKLADRIGNRPLLVINGILMSILPLLWLYTDAELTSVWIVLPLLHMLQGATFAALDLCLSNIQLELAPSAKQSGYFAIAAAITGTSGALGTTAGSLIAEISAWGLPALFVISAVVRLLSLIPLTFVQEERAHPMREILSPLLKRLPIAKQPAQAEA